MLIAIWLSFGSAVFASRRGANGILWFCLGILLGPIGLVLSLFAGSGRVCPACRKGIHPQATKCPYCQSVFPEQPVVVWASKTYEQRVGLPTTTKGWMISSCVVLGTIALVCAFAKWH